MNNILKYGLILSFAGAVGYFVYKQMQADAGLKFQAKISSDEKGK